MPIETKSETLSQRETSLSESIGAAERLLRTGNWRKAERLCLKMVEHGDDADAVRLLGTMHMQAGRPAEAFPWLERAVSLEPGSAPARFALARALQAMGNMREAAGAWLAGIEIDPSEVFDHIGPADWFLAIRLYAPGTLAGRHTLLGHP